MKSSIRAWYALFRFLYCRTGMLFTIVLCTLVTLTVMAAHFLLGASEGMRALYKGLYLVCVLLNLIMVVNLPTQLNLLASRKTLLLSGNGMLHGLLMVSVLVMVLSLGLAPIIYSPWDYAHYYLKTAMVISSVCFLGIILSTVMRVNILLALFFISTVVLGADRVGAILNYLVENINLVFWAFVVMTFLAWGIFCRSLKSYGLKKSEPVAHWGSVDFMPENRESLEHMNILGFMPKLKPGSDAQKNFRIMLMESDSRFGSYVLLYAVIALLLLAAKFLLILFFQDFGGFSTYQSSGLILILLPSVLTLFCVSNISANLRRLWLVMPGNRRDHMQYLIEQWESLQLLLTLVFWFPGTALLAMSGLPWVWLAFFVAFSWCAYFSLSFFILLTRLSQASWMPVFRFVTVGLCVLAGVYLWVTKDFLLTAIAAAFMASSSEFIKDKLLRTWQQQNYSELKIMEMGV